MLIPETREAHWKERRVRPIRREVENVFRALACLHVMMCVRSLEKQPVSTSVEFTNSSIVTPTNGTFLCNIAVFVFLKF